MTNELMVLFIVFGCVSYATFFMVSPALMSLFDDIEEEDE